MAKNNCYDSDCDDENCYNPEHYNYICFDPECDDIHCTNIKHFDKNLLKEYQENTDLSVHDHSDSRIVDENADISLCGCSDCCDEDHDHEHDHDHGHEHEHHHDDDESEEEEELLAEGKPLIANRPIQIIVVSGICFALGHILEFLSFNPTVVTIIFMIGAVIAGY